MALFVSNETHQKAVAQLSAANQENERKEGELQRLRETADSARYETERLKTEVQRWKQQAEQAEARIAERAEQVAQIANAGGWYGFGDSWFLLDAITHFKTMTDIHENLCVDAINGRSIGDSLPTVEQVLAALEARRQAREQEGRTGGAAY